MRNILSVLCAVIGVFIATVLYFSIVNSFPESEVSKVFWVAGLSVLTGTCLGASLQHLSSVLEKKKSRAP